MTIRASRSRRLPIRCHRPAGRRSAHGATRGWARSAAHRRAALKSVVAAAYEKRLPPSHTAPRAGSQADIDAMLSQPERDTAPEPVEEPPAPDILDLTESMWGTAEDEFGQFRHHRRTIGRGVSRGARSFEPEPPPSALRLSRRRAPSAQSSDWTLSAVDLAFNTLAHTVFWCRMPARLRIWCAKCCARCSSPGSMTTCRGRSSGWCAPKSSACRAEGRSLRCDRVSHARPITAESVPTRLKRVP